MRSARQHLVILFTDIANSTSLSARLDVEDFEELLASFRQVISASLKRHGGTLIRIDGDGALCAFGYPEPLEDAGSRAVNAALEIHDQMERKNAARPIAEVRVHTGIHAGLVLVRPGDMVRGAIEVLGETTNVAARLCDLAKPDNILVSDDVLGGDQNLFITESWTSFEPLAAAVQVRRVLARSDKSSRLDARRDRFNSPFVGRDNDCQLIKNWINQGEPPTLLLHADAGHGKSRLLQLMSKSVGSEGHRPLLACCGDLETGRPLDVLYQIARAAGLVPKGQKNKSELTEMIMRAVHTLTARGEKVLLIVDDWQWADESVIAFVEHLLNAKLRGVKILLASRTCELRISSITAHVTHSLTPLTSPETQRLIDALLPHADPITVNRIRDAAGGSPLIIEELCDIPEAALRGDARKRSSFRLASLVQQRLSKQALDLLAATEKCAVVGLSIPHWLFCAIFADQDPEQLKTLLLTDSFIYQDRETDSFHFRHGLIREAVYDQTPIKKRREIHGLIARAFLGKIDPATPDEHLEAVALHLAAAANPEAIEYCLRAGDRAMRLGSLDRASQQYRTAVDLIDKNPSLWRPELIRRLGARYSAAALPDPHPEHLAPIAKLAKAARACEDRRSVDLIAYAQGSIHYTIGNPRAAFKSIDWPWAEKTIHHDDDLEGPRQVLVGQSLFLQNHHPEARQMIENAVRGMAVSGKASHRHALIYHLGMLGQIIGDQGNLVDAFGHFAKAEELASEPFPPMFANVMSQKGAVHLWAGDNEACLSTMLKSREIADRVGSRYGVMIAGALIAYVHFLEKPSEASLLDMELSARWFEDTRSLYALPLTLGWCAHAAWELGDGDRARQHALKSLALSKSGLRWGNPLACRILALTSEDDKKASAWLKRSYTTAARMQSPREWAHSLIVQAQMTEQEDPEYAAIMRHEAEKVWAPITLFHTQ